MTMPGESFPGAGLWSISGQAPTPRPGVRFKVPEQLPAAPALAQGPICPPVGPPIPSPIVVENEKVRTPWTCPCKIKCCGYDFCARCCCPCTCCRCCLWSCVIIVAFILSIGIVVLVFWKVLHPKFPMYNVDNVKFTYGVTGSSSSNANAPSGPSSYVLNTTTLFTMEIGNPNTKIGIYYDQIKLSMELFGLAIGNQIIPPFYDGFNVTDYIQVNMTSGPVTLTAANEAALSTAETAGNVPLNLNIDVKVRIKIGLYKTPQLKLYLDCVVGVDPTISSGSQIKGMSCKFGLKL